MGPFPLGCVALVRGGGGGFGGNAPRYVQFRDKQHVEQRLKALGATIVQRNGPRVTHVVVPAGGEALAEEQRRHGVHHEGGGQQKGIIAREKGGGESNGAKSGGGGGGGGGGGEGKDGFEVGDGDCDGDGDDDVDLNTHDLDVAKGGVGVGSVSSSTKSGGGKGKAGGGAGPVVVTEGWVMRHVRASKTGVAAAHDPAALRAHQTRVASERKKEAGSRRVHSYTCDSLRRRKRHTLNSGGMCVRELN